MVGETICISPPGSAVPPNWQKETKDVEVPKPSNGDPKSNKKCGEWHTIEAGDTCGNLRISYKLKESELFFLNPGLNYGVCENLNIGTAYCVHPVGSIRQYPDWQPVFLPPYMTATIDFGQKPNNQPHTSIWPNATAPTPVTITQYSVPSEVQAKWSSYTLCPDFAAENPDFKDGNIPE
ncbi:hypothetical protein ABW20_dc0107651 [Dactylellina cionopaga]|nr:hypothetical protein ABW20_dc0107651 [Dactylellina cionopaga]